MTCCAYAPAFEALFAQKKSTDLLIERIFKPARFPEFHAHLGHIHEAWIAGQTSQGGQP